MSKKKPTFVPFETFLQAQKKQEQEVQQLAPEQNNVLSTQQLLELEFLEDLFPGIDRDVALDVLIQAGSLCVAVERLLSFDSDEPLTLFTPSSPPPPPPPPPADKEGEPTILTPEAKQISEILPEASPNAIQFALDQCEGDVEKAVSLLMEEPEKIQFQAQFEQNRSRARASNWASWNSKALHKKPQQSQEQFNVRGGDNPEDPAIVASRPLDLASKIKFEQLKTRFPFISDSLLIDTFFACNRSIDETINILAEIFPFIQKPKPKPTPPPQTTTQNVAPPGSVIDVSCSNQRAHSPTPKNKEISVTEMNALLEECTQIRNSRDQLYREAVNAFNRGDGAAAKELAEEGHKLDGNLRENRKITISNSLESRSLSNNFVDLHGLTVAETKDVLGSMFSASNTLSSKVVIVTGIGKHSKAGLPKLQPAVREFLKSKGLKFSERSGCFIVHITNKH